MKRHLLIPLACYLVCWTAFASAQDKPKRKAALTAKEADADFAVQGEYVGEIQGDDGKEKFGVQVIALGGGKFRGVGYSGGLPGDGWDTKEKISADGETKDGVTTFVADDVAMGVIKDGVLTVLTDDGDELGTLKRIIRKSKTLGAKPPKNAVVLFDGTTPKHFKGGRMTEDGLLMQGVTSHQKFGSFKLHMEFLLSYMPYARGQGRGNSGLYMQGRYETQILDSFGLEGKNNECGGIYEIRDPDLNMCFPPLSWQTYDVDFTAAKYDKNGKKLKNARMTVRLNGVVVHKDAEVPRTTRAAPVKEGPEPGPVYIQNHSNPLRFRNIWLVEKADAVAAADSEDGYISLFDGKTLKGWHKNPQKIGHGTGGHWYVENGVITGEQDPPGSGNGGILLTDRKFGDFELLIDMKPDWGVCSGLFVRGNDKGQCFQMMVDYHDNGNVGHIYGEGSGGFNSRPFVINGVYGKDKQLLKLVTVAEKEMPQTRYTATGSDWVKAWKINDWNTAKVRVVGNPPNITTWINGVKINEFDGKTFKHSRYDKDKVASLLTSEGRIAVQVHGGTGWPKGAKCHWKNIRIRPLSP